MDPHLCDTLHTASSRGHNECIITLLAKGANVNIKDKNGLTPLHIVSWQGNHDCLNTLLKAGTEGGLTDINEKDNKGRTVLHNACYQSCEKCLQLLLDYGANLNERDYYGAVPLDFAESHIKVFIDGYFESNLIKEPDHD
jgi:ankyrin repeat protein